ncbi:glyoxalase bleomycin resistance protein dioxygenase protein [Diplodia corticola]|uniref:Glyoxalase bleomycin resistance protein dioxygenase protein n=1 Tax=Diplodia corticola TaxID=236234 RepID=A0A1J9RK16_9PEZI|nr:glyoxalase bleomycin resistance protein dioxygenase protein [Diplodia corticola]OJD28863.1 glyoxalase bleomycin resistance protein dioxygenase protein [Diplodia corticola]
MADYTKDQLNGKTTKVISPIRLAHVVLRTRPESFANMVAFYKAFLGAETSHQNDFISFMTYDEEHHRIAIVAMPDIGPKDAKTAGLEHIAFTFSTVHDLLTAYTQRKALGIAPVWCVNHGPTLSIYYRDPDGNHIETQVDVFDTPDETNAYMLDPAFAENPIGVDFDPDETIRKLGSGEASVRDVLTRPNVGKRDLSDVPMVKV